MFVFMLLGYIMRKKKLGGEGVGGALAAIEVYICLPALSFSTFAQNFRRDAMAAYLPFLLAGIITIAVSFLISKLLSRLFSENRLQRDVYMYSFLIPNIGYMGYPIISAVFGEKLLLSMMVYTIPFNLMIYTYGFYILNPKREWSLKKVINSNTCAIALGIACGLFNFKLPALADNIITSAKVCMSPLAMILTGFVLGGVQAKPMLLDVKSYIAAFVRAIAIPLAALFTLLLLNIRGELMTIVVATLCMPFGLNSVIFPEAFGSDSKTGAKISFISNIMSIITIPAVFAAVSYFN